MIPESPASSDVDRGGIPEATHAAQPAGRRIVLTTFGSLGDLHPYIALARGLAERGHRPVLATSAVYRPRVESLGIEFCALRPDQPDLLADTSIIRRIMDSRGGSEYVVRELVMPSLAQTYEDTLAAASGADLLVAHPLTFTTPLAAETLGIPWVSSMLAPLGFFSAYDPPVLPPAQWLRFARFLGRPVWRPLLGSLKLMVRSWSEPFRRFRDEIGLPGAADPLFEGQHSPDLVLALFSKLLGAPQPDWPPQTVVTGFAFFDRSGDAGMPAELSDFLAAGPPPIVFTLGSSAVLDAGPFYEHSARAAEMLGRRAVLLVGADPRNRPARLPAGVLACEYAPYSELFPKAAAVVHQAGAGTTGQAMRAGKPMLVMPYAHDQPDNAHRVVRLGIARHIARGRYTAAHAAAELRKLLEDPRHGERAAEVGRRVQSEDGVGTACDAIERVLASARVS